MTQQTSAIQSNGAHRGDRIHLKLLVITAVRSDPNLEAIVALFNQLGIAYDTLIATEQALTQAQLWQGREAFYQGVILTTGNLLYWNVQADCWQSAFDEAMWQLLWHFERRFALRHLVLYAVGTAPETYGLHFGELITTDTLALPLLFTEWGRCLFSDLNHAGLVVSGAPVYLAQPMDEATIPLLQTATGETVAIIRHETDGRELVALTIGHSPDLLHTWLLGYGLLNWVTRGLFLGERRIYLSIQIDDIFNQNWLWNPACHCVGNCLYRLSAADAQALVAWLDRVQLQTRNGAHLMLDFAFNGAGIMGAVADDALATTLLQQQTRFRWINHGYTHLLLDHATYAESEREILANHQAAVALGLLQYRSAAMVTAVVSGLENDDFLRAAKDTGIQYLVSDTSKAGWHSPSPNTGICNPLQPAILCIPRRPTNLFYDVSTPEEWVAKYNHTYASYWGRDLALAEIIEVEAEMILGYLLRFEINPLMFHQGNLRAYDGVHSLLSLLIDRVLQKYNTLYSDVPVISLGMHEIGAAMQARTAYNEAQVEAVWLVGQGLSLLTKQDLVLSITGFYLAGKSEWYAGQPITRLPLKANIAYQFPLSSKES